VSVPLLLEALEAIAHAQAGGPAVAVATVVEGGPLGARLLCAEDGTVRGTLGAAALDARAGELLGALLARGGTALERIESDAGPITIFLEAHRAPERLLVVGAGHIAVPLARLGVELGFAVSVLDDREEFASAERFEPDVSVRRADFAADPFAGVTIDARTYVALVTRGHRWDFECLQRLLALPEPPRYIGMIGSRRRVRAALHALLESGMAATDLAAVRAPIGLDIGAETPAEIAVSIAAELIAVRRGADAPSLTAREHVLDRLLTHDAPPES
jgi:xanthine dehydrogenase accessory factor